MLTNSSYRIQHALNVHQTVHPVSVLPTINVKPANLDTSYLKRTNAERNARLNTSLKILTKTTPTASDVIKAARLVKVKCTTNATVV